MSKKQLLSRIKTLENFIGVIYTDNFGGEYIPNEYGNWKYLKQFINEQQTKEEIARRKLFK